MSELPAIGELFEVPYPFVRDTYTEHDMDEEGFHESDVPTWRPGTRNEFVYPDDVECVADAMGTQILTVVGVYRPGRFPTRVFYERQWRDPDGKVFGKRKCRMTTVSAFRALVQGFRVPFELKTKVA